MEKSWYSGLILLESIHSPEDEYESIWEECIYLVQANDHEEAMGLLEQTGHNLELEYQAAAGNDVRWRFDGVDRLERLGDLEGEGMEVFSRFLRASEVAAIRKPFDDEDDQPEITPAE